MAAPFATNADYSARRAIPAGVTTAQIDILLSDASTSMRAEAKAVGVDLDARIIAEVLDAEMAKIVAIDMVAEALRRRSVDQPAGSTVQQTNGPFSDTLTMPAALPDDLFLTRAMRKRLGIGQRAFTVPMYAVPES